MGNENSSQFEIATKRKMGYTIKIMSIIVQKRRIYYRVKGRERRGFNNNQRVIPSS